MAMLGKSDTSVRLARVERALIHVLEIGRQARNENAALRVALEMLVESLRPEDDLAAREWLDRMEAMALACVSLQVDLGTDGIIEKHGLDMEKIEAAEHDRDAISQILADLYAGLRDDG